MVCVADFMFAVSVAVVIIVAVVLFCRCVVIAYLINLSGEFGSPYLGKQEQRYPLLAA